jgi:hypothetical protein
MQISRVHEVKTLETSIHKNIRVSIICSTEINFAAYSISPVVFCVLSTN